MKITIEVEPREAAEFLAEFVGKAHKVCARGEQTIIDMIMRSMEEPKKKDSIITEEVPAGGHFH